MSATQAVIKETSQKQGTKAIDMKLEVVVLSVSDVDRAKGFYSELGWRLDIDFTAGDAFRVVQFTPPGSGTSIHFGKGLTSAEPGSGGGVFLVVSDIDKARADLHKRGVAVSEVFHRLLGEEAQGGRDPENRSYTSLATFNDPDGNRFVLQEIKDRLAGRVDGSEIKFRSSEELEQAFRRAETAHGEHEKRTGKRDEEWPAWYAEYMFAEQTGATPRSRNVFEKKEIEATEVKMMSNSITQIENVVYTAKVHTMGGRDGGTTRTSDGRLDVRLSPPGSSRDGTNPEQLFAVGWSSCYLSAMKLVAARMKVRLPIDAAVDAEVDVGTTNGAYFIQARLKVSPPALNPGLHGR